MAQIISQIRETKRKPKLHDVLDFFKNNQDSKADKETIINKIYQLYSKESLSFQEKEDKKFDQLMITFDRLKKLVIFQNDTLNEMDQRLS